MIIQCDDSFDQAKLFLLIRVQLQQSYRLPFTNILSPCDR